MLPAVGARHNVLCHPKCCLSAHNRKQVAQQFLLPVIDYKDVILHTATAAVFHRLDIMYNKALQVPSLVRLLLDAPR